MTESLTACIAGKMIALQFPVLPLVDHWAPFLVKNGEHSIIQTIKEDEIPFQMPFYGVSFLREGLGGRIAQSASDPRVLISYSEDWRHVTASGVPGGELFELIITAFYSRLSRLEPAMLLHASAVRHEKEAVVFIGPSGIGKTTQAELWQKHLDAEIINGDKVFVRIAGDRPVAFGSPWSGSSPYIVNKSAGIKGIVLLHQGPENKIVKLTNLYAFQSLSKHTFFPQWDRLCTANVIQMLGFVLKRTPVFLLTCRPEEEAVQITKRAIWQ
jgi:hypothetical protein